MKLWLQVFEDEKKSRESLDKEKLCTYGIKCLDDSLKFIMNNDLVVIGADSGIGKSELALTIAMENIGRGKKVALYYLEGGEQEAMARLKWRLITDKYYNKYSHLNLNIDYISWKTNTLDCSEELKKIEEEVKGELIRKYSNRLWLYDVTESITIESVLSSLLDFHSLEFAIKNGPFNKSYDIDLIIIDHLQYFELAGKETEIQQTTNILRQAKLLTDIHKIPVILVSHLRKKDKKRGLPDQEDFYGTSNIPKISSVAITLSTDFNNSDFNANIFPTYFRVVKSRVGVRSNYCMKVNFDLNKRKYDSKYELYYVNSEGFNSNEPIAYDKLPKWAKENNLTMENLIKEDKNIKQTIDWRNNDT